MANDSEQMVVYELLPDNLRDIHSINEKIVFSLSLLANAVLIAVLAAERHPALRQYSRVLQQNCGVDIVQTIGIFCGELELEFADGNMITMINGVFRNASTPVHYFLTFLGAFVCATAVSALSIIFIFRYMLIVKNRVMANRDIHKLLVVPILSGAIVGGTMVGALVSGDDRRAHLCPRLLNNSIWLRPGTDITRCLICKASNPFLILYQLACTSVIGSAYIVMSLSTIAILRATREARKESTQRTRQMQRQLNVVLFAQMTLPIFSAVMPVLVMTSLPALRISMPGAGVAVMLAFSWMPLLSPLTTLMFVGRFRHRIMLTAGRIILLGKSSRASVSAT